MCETYFITERGDIHTPSHVGTSYQQVNTYAQSCSLSLHQSMFEFCGSRFSYWLFLSQPGDTNRVVICCCPHGREPEASWDRPGERNLCVCVYTCKSLHVCIRMPPRISPNLNHSTPQSTAEQLWQCHKSQLAAATYNNLNVTWNVKQSSTPSASIQSVFSCLSHLSSAGL